MLWLIQMKRNSGRLGDLVWRLPRLLVPLAAPSTYSSHPARLLNANFQATVAQQPGGLEALIAIGFKEVESIEEVRSRWP